MRPGSDPERFEFLSADEPLVEPAGKLGQLATHHFRIESFLRGALDHPANGPERDPRGCERDEQQMDSAGGGSAAVNEAR